MRRNTGLLSSVILSVALLCLSGAAAVAGGLDFEKVATYGGDWSIEYVDGEPQIVQKLPSGQAARILFIGNELPQRFSFEAEFGVISGNHAEHRPYFGIVFNKQYAGEMLPRLRGYRFDFRPSQYQWELIRSTDTESILLASYPDVMPWEWDLKEWRTLRIVRDGSLIQAYVNGELYIEVEDDELQGGYVGVWTYSTAAVFRNLKLEALE